MKNDRSRGRLSHIADTPQAIDDLAAFALDCVATVRVRTDRDAPNPDLSRRLLDAAMSRSGEAHRDVVAGMLQSGVSPEAIADVYIPDVARRMGTEWEDDLSNFAQVTLGSVRLQGILRELDAIWDTGHSGLGPDSRPMIRVLTVAEAQHTLGANVVATQLRRLGCSVRVQVGIARHAEAADDACDAIFVSAAKSDPIAKVAEMVLCLRAAPGTTPPIILGGSLLDDAPDAAARTGVDHTGHDCVSALELCGIRRRWTSPELS